MSGIIQSKFHVFKGLFFFFLWWTYGGLQGLLFPEVLIDVNFARIRGGIREIWKN